MKLRVSVRRWALLGCMLQLGWLVGCGSSEPPPPPVPPPAPATSGTSQQPVSSAEPSSDELAEEDTAGMEPSADDRTAMGDMSGIMPGNVSSEPGANYQGMPMSMGGMPTGGGGGGLAGTESIYEGGMMASGMGGGMGGMGGMGGPGGPAFVDPAPDEDADYLTKAKYAFAIGKEVVGEQYAIAHMLANDAESASMLQQIRYSPGAHKPAMTVRFAVGVNLKAPSTITDYKPIGRTQFAQQNGGGGGMNMDMGMGGRSGGQNQSAQKTFEEYTGRFGEELVKSFETAWDSGNFGTVFKDVETIVPVNRPTNGAGGMRGMASMGGMSMGGMGMPMDIGGEGGGGGPNNAAPADSALRGKATPGKQIVPGLMFLGTGTKAELIGKAETEGIDYLFLFDVTVENSRMGAKNETKLTLWPAKGEKALGATSTLNALEVDRKMAAKGDNDEVAKNIGSLFKRVDTLKLVDMPAIKPAGAQSRIKSLIEKKSKDVLPILMEIKLFHSLGLLNDEERDAAYQLTVGGNGLALVNGTAEDREFVLTPMLPAYK